jgi:hypothetical protein
MKQQIIFLALWILPLAVAFNCDSLGGGDLHICNSINEANLTQTEKDLLIADIFNKNKTTPNFDFVELWNTNLDLTTITSKEKYSSGVISDAWMRIVSLMPSIIENETLYSSTNEKLLTTYNYQYTLPTKTAKGDCKTEYFLESKSEDLSIYLNDKLVGKEKLSSFIISNELDNLTFRADLNINVRYRIVRYYLRSSSKCIYYSTEYKTDSLVISGYLNAKLYNNNLSSEFKILDRYNDITKGNLTASNFTKLILNFNNSFYQNSRYTYSFNYTPDYVLTIKAEKLEYLDFNNIYVDKNDESFIFTVKDSTNCKIELYDHFNSISKNCDMSFDKTNFSIKTNKINYLENETIKIYILPSNITITLSYANQTKTTKNYTEFNATLYQNKITAKIGNEEFTYLINVNKKENWKILFDIILLIFLAYLFYKLTKFAYSKHSK